MIPYLFANLGIPPVKCKTGFTIGYGDLWLTTNPAGECLSPCDCTMDYWFAFNLGVNGRRISKGQSPLRADRITYTIYWYAGFFLPVSRCLLWLYLDL